MFRSCFLGEDFLFSFFFLLLLGLWRFDLCMEFFLGYYVCEETTCSDPTFFLYVLSVWGFLLLLLLGFWSSIFAWFFFFCVCVWVCEEAYMHWSCFFREDFVADLSFFYWGFLLLLLGFLEVEFYLILWKKPTSSHPA